MSKEAGRGFALQVTQSNFVEIAPLLRDMTKDPQEPSSDSSAGESVSTKSGSSFEGSKISVVLPFSWGTPRTPPETGTINSETESTNVESADDSDYSPSVLVAEIPGPGRWTQASFSQRVFVEFFGAVVIELTYIDSSGTPKHETANPIEKKSKNYCYELGAAVGLDYPNISDGRPIGVFLSMGGQEFQYKLVMPSDPDHTVLDLFLTDKWTGPARWMRRIITDLDTLLSTWPTAGLPFETSGTADG